MLGYYAVTIGLRPHHVVIWGALLVAGLVPAWGSVGSDAKINVGLMLMGAASIVAGPARPRRPPALVRPGGGEPPCLRSSTG